MRDQEDNGLREPGAAAGGALSWPPTPRDDGWVHRLTHIVHTMDEGLQVLGRDFRYLYVNEAAARHGNRRREELLGHTLPELYPGVEETELWEHLTRCMREAESHRMVNEFQFPDGRRGWFELRMEPVPEGLLLLSVDITERRNLESQLGKAQKMEALGRLAGGVAHDFNNFLTVISSYAEFLDAPRVRAMDRRLFAAQIRQAADRAARLTRQLLNLGRGQMVRPQFVAVDFNIKSLLPMMRLLLSDEAKMSLQLGSNGFEVCIDPGELDQIMLNLVSNANDAMPEGGRVVVSSGSVMLDADSVPEGAKAGRHVRICVQDSGVGMDLKTRERVFEPFFTTKDRDCGTGLGLSMCAEIVRRAGGFLTVESSVGEGATFCLHLPVATPENQVDQECGDASPAERAAQGRILVVDDDEALREVCVRVLTEAGYVVSSAVNAQQALDLATGRDSDGSAGGVTPFDILVTDIVMPGVHGPQLAAELGEIWPGLRALFMSGYARPEVLRSIASEQFLAKPFTPSELTAKVAELAAQI